MTACDPKDIAPRVFCRGCRLYPQMARVVASRLAALSAGGIVKQFLRQLL
jgi:hypothetical protein